MCTMVYVSRKNKKDSNFIFHLKITIFTAAVKAAVCYRIDFVAGVPQIRKRNAVQYLLTTPASPDIEAGIVTECCRKACSIQDMESYCAAAPGTIVAKPTNGPLVRNG